MNLNKYSGARAMVEDLGVTRMPGDNPRVFIRVPAELVDGTVEVFSMDMTVDHDTPEDFVHGMVTRKLLEMAKTWKAWTGDMCEFVNDDLRARVMAEFAA